MLTEHQIPTPDPRAVALFESAVIQLAHDIADKLTDAWRLRFRSIPPAEDTLLACGFVLAQMRLATEETKQPFYTHTEVAKLVDNALAHPAVKHLDRARFSDDLVRICVLFRLATVGYHGVIVEDDFFVRWLGLGAYNGK
ncbi:hypothetical protein [Escherichia coli]|uniref:hypothetical protein n=1 Tax=Escherichia coli TaxID=562 RepID=UPI000BB7DF8E|nr:hypothetical protein [Escherichia coli]